MSDALIISNIVLWVMVVLLAGIVVALVRQMGVLYERVAPVGALMTGKGPVVGETAPVMQVTDITGAARQVGGARADGRSTLLFFLSPTCPVCKSLLPVLHSAGRRERGWLEIVLASDGTREEHEPFVREHGLERYPYVLSTALGVTHQIAKLPYAVLLDGAGVVRAKGLVNTREHLESLFEAKERGVASLQDFMEAARQ